MSLGTLPELVADVTVLLHMIWRWKGFYNIRRIRVTLGLREPTGTVGISLGVPFGLVGIQAQNLFSLGTKYGT